MRTLVVALALWLIVQPAGAPLSASWQGDALRITIAEPAPARCLYLSGGGRLTTFLPDSCGVTTYTIPPGGDANYRPNGRTLQLVDTGALIYALPVPLRSEISLPLVVGP